MKWILGALMMLALPAVAGGGGDCDTFYNHSGFIPGSYDYAILYEAGFDPVFVETNGQNINVSPPEGRRSWDQVDKCHERVVVTTIGTTTTTESSTTSTTQTSTTTTTEQSTTSSQPDSTTTTDPSTTAPSTTPDELPFTGLDLSVLVVAGLGTIGLGWLIVRKESEV